MKTDISKNELDNVKKIVYKDDKTILKIEKDIGLVVIDYLQLIQGSGKKNASREQEISEISRSLKILAKELDIPVIALSQLSRAPEQRPDHRPMLSDLRESGSIEQDADMVIFIHRNTEPDANDQEQGKKDGSYEAEFIIAKFRSGEPGSFFLGWDGSRTTFVGINSALNPVFVVCITSFAFASSTTSSLTSIP